MVTVLETAGTDEADGRELARRPLLRMMDPSALESINVDRTPGLAARRDRLSKVDRGYIYREH